MLIAVQEAFLPITKAQLSCTRTSLLLTTLESTKLVTLEALAKRKDVQQQHVINDLTSTLSNRDVRVHDSVNYCVRNGVGGINCIPGCLVSVPVWINNKPFPVCIVDSK